MEPSLHWDCQMPYLMLVVRARAGHRRGFALQRPKRFPRFLRPAAPTAVSPSVRRTPSAEILEVAQRAQQDFAHPLDSLCRLLARDGPECSLYQPFGRATDLRAIRVQGFRGDAAFAKPELYEGLEERM
jgi:hypothetical protein